MRIVVLLFLATIAPAYADKGDSYFGFLLSNNSADWDGEESFSGLDTEASLSSGFEGFWGTFLSDQLAFEISLKSMGSMSLEGRQGDQFELDGTTYVWTQDVYLDTDISAWTSRLRYDLFNDNKFTLFGNIGWALGTYSYESDISSIDGDEDRFSSSIYGFGVEYSLDDRTELRVVYDVINNDDVFTGVHIGLVYRYK